MKYVYMAMTCILLMACSKKTAETGIDDIYSPGSEIKMRMVGGEAYYIPKATIFKMNGDYADHVAVTLNPDGSLAYYPAPTDIMGNSAPYDLGNGWYLNRQGLSSNSVFTKWTFDEYRKLKSTPSREEILNAIIPGSKVTEMQQIPISLSEAISNPEKCRGLIP